MEIIPLGFFLRLEILSLWDFVILCWGYWFIRGLILLMDIREIGFPSELFHFVMSFVLSLDVLWFGFRGALFDIFDERFGDLPYSRLDRHTVTLSCMHAGFPPPWRGDKCFRSPSVFVTRWDLSFVISSSEPSVRSISVVRGLVWENGRSIS